MGEIAENCAGVKLVLVALKCDLREKATDEEEDAEAVARREKQLIDYHQGLEVARRIGVRFGNHPLFSSLFRMRIYIYTFSLPFFKQPC